MATVHHLNCATMCPAAAPRLGLADRHPGHLVAHCLLIEDPGGLILIDTGFGTQDVARPAQLGPARFALSAQFDASETAIARVRSLGFDPTDVRHILVTHLDLDHAGGLGDFPNALVHLHSAELAAATARARIDDRLRYRPAHWAHGPHWAEHAESGEPWLGFDRVRLIDGLDTEIAMLPLFGHTAGHSGYAINTSDGWLLHAGDAYLRRIELASPQALPLALTGYHRLNSHDHRARRANAERLAELAADHPDVTVFCSHDANELPTA
jgi:glyoxylase-like metal-dependent hydrolase (beta-lactamase superfamily II)